MARGQNTTGNHLLFGPRYITKETPKLVFEDDQSIFEFLKQSPKPFPFKPSRLNGRSNYIQQDEEFLDLLAAGDVLVNEGKSEHDGKVFVCKAKPVIFAYQNPRGKSFFRGGHWFTRRSPGNHHDSLWMSSFAGDLDEVIEKTNQEFDFSYRRHSHWKKKFTSEQDYVFKELTREEVFRQLKQRS